MRATLRPGTPLVAGFGRLSLPSYGFPAFNTDGAVSASSTRARATATAAVTTHTKGTWQEIIAATVTDSDYLILSLTAATGVNATDTSSFLDIGIGAALSEVVVVPNIQVGNKTNAAGSFVVFSGPCRIPVGSRVAIRCQAAVTLQTAAVEMSLGSLAQYRRAPTPLVSIGANGATSRGVGLSVPGANNTKGAWTEITSALVQPLGALVPLVDTAGDAAITTGAGLLDIGVGSAGNELVLPGGGDLPVAFIGTTDTANLNYPAAPIPCRLPAGTRVAARYATSSTASSLGLSLIGIPA